MFRKTKLEHLQLKKTQAICRTLLDVSTACFIESGVRTGTEELAFLSHHTAPLKENGYSEDTHTQVAIKAYIKFLKGPCH